jgi:processive 1,2-diacylglycerol beta-glucosyltransferase
MLNTKRKRHVWIFSLSALDQSVPFIRLVSPFRHFPKDEYEFVYVPSLSALTKILFIPDIIILQRILYPLKEMRKIMEFADSRGIPVILEVDDLITNVPRQHVSFVGYEPIKADIEQLVRDVDFVTVTNNRLKGYLEPYNPNIYVLPNLIDERIWPAEGRRAVPDDNRTVIGYAGSLPHTYDLKIVIPAIRYIMAKYKDKVSFKFIGCIPEEL